MKKFLFYLLLILLAGCALTPLIAVPQDSSTPPGSSLLGELELSPLFAVEDGTEMILKGGETGLYAWGTSADTSGGTFLNNQTLNAKLGYRNAPAVITAPIYHLRL